MPKDTFYVAPDALDRLKSPKSPPKVFTVDFTMTGQLVIVADSPAEAYQQAIMWSQEELARISNLEMDDPEDRGVVQ